MVARPAYRWCVPTPRPAVRADTDLAAKAAELAVERTDLAAVAAELDPAGPDVHVVSLPLNTRFRGIDTREALLVRGPAGWGEFSPFLEYPDEEAAWWLAAGLEAAWFPPVQVLRSTVEVNATVPAVAAGEVAGVLARFAGCTTAKVKVAEAGQDLTADLDRVAAVREALGPAGRIRVDANGAWDVEQAVCALTALAGYDLEYAEQPVAGPSDLVRLRTALTRVGVAVPLAADESVRRATDPFAVALAGAVDVVVVKVAPLGGLRRTLRVAEVLRAQHGVDVVLSSALDTSVGLSAGVRAAAALPGPVRAAGLGTAALLAADVTADPLLPVAGAVAARAVEPDHGLLSAHAAEPGRQQWWRARLERCLAVLQARR